VLVELARRPPDDARQLRTVRGLTSQQAEKWGRRMIEAIQDGMTNPPPTLPPRNSFPPAMEPTVDFLFVCLRSIAVEKSVAPGMVASRGDMNRLAVQGEDADIPLMRGWRRESFGDELLATLDGRATARIIPETREVQLVWSPAE
jgi:ribonuclease D